MENVHTIHNIEMYGYSKVIPCYVFMFKASLRGREGEKEGESERRHR